MTPADLTPARAALARVRERHAAATPGPWCTVVKGNTVQSLAIEGVCSGISPKTGNGPFIAAARTSEPLLADCADALVRLVTALNYAVSDWRDSGALGEAGRAADAALLSLGDAP